MASNAATSRAREFPEVAVIGAGPAGIAAALQLALLDVPFVWFEADRLGGLLCDASQVENFPGMADAPTGPELVRRLARHLARRRLRPTPGEVVSIALHGNLFRLVLKGADLVVRRVVCATGTRPRPPPFAVPEPLAGRVHSTIDRLRRAKGHTIAVVGAGDIAFDWALALQGRNRVVVLNRSARPRCTPGLAERARASRLEVLSETTVESVGGDAKRLSLRLSRGPRLECHDLVFAIGREPRLPSLAGELPERLRSGELADRFLMVGDVRNGLVRQSAVATGDGVRAAMQVFLASRGRR